MQFREGQFDLSVTRP
nr:unnamed protein product [Callosobruchus chinensis]CAH7743324.1 unnamed protein product [Callosobruchus chinensis]CAH7760657.1 unnamed protein product [Callosobruchus chinensis]CAH7762147.1 unnamed protein product [Callosobruchus chinensis]